MRLIDADKTIGLLKTRLYETALNNANVNCDASYLYTECADNRIDTWIDELPTIELKRGKWITKKDACGIGYQICSNCETEIQWRDRHGVILRVDMQSAPFCPNCGAKMERSEE